MKIEIIKCLEDNFSYLLIDEINRNAVVIDPSEAKPVINKLETLNLKLKFIMNTHHHYDHVGGNKELKKLYNAKMINLIGDEITPYRNKTFKDNEFFYDYLKTEIKNKRKMGHITIIKK